ncbi:MULTISPECIES: DUF6232 family protein [Burkholderiaceae]|jgi:hypothetical protein|uniref:Uncharacterized protein n=1 Tax=Caballeronia sordidicola TaxID=196367 RepID=A0A242MS40_CABSO|nr:MULTISPECIES: DUF6232 family protein [Burkholderiaceae]AME25864.1 hypothetical protein AXG89_18150 [Burkholderia sp. PAMC 26561]OTP73816.1 hypothetical protein PAMC26577_17175 [Caballeronia sordidicola]
MQHDLPFNERGITFARAGLSAAGQLFPLRDLRGATVKMIPRQKPLPIAVSVIGVIVAAIGGVLGSGPALVLGIMIAVVGYLSWITQDVIYRMYVTVPDGEREVFTTKDEEFAQRVATLVREAVTARTAAQADTQVPATTPPVQEGL